MGPPNIIVNIITYTHLKRIKFYISSTHWYSRLVAACPNGHKYCAMVVDICSNGFLDEEVSDHAIKLDHIITCHFLPSSIAGHHIWILTLTISSKSLFCLIVYLTIYTTSIHAIIILARVILNDWRLQCMHWISDVLGRQMSAFIAASMRA